MNSITDNLSNNTCLIIIIISDNNVHILFYNCFIKNMGSSQKSKRSVSLRYFISVLSLDFIYFIQLLEWDVKDKLF